MRDFIHGALLEFERADFKKLPGKAPTAYFYDQHGSILEEILIGKMKRFQHLIHRVANSFTKS